MADRLLVHNIKLMTAPPLSEWNGQALSRTQLKEIQIEGKKPDEARERIVRLMGDLPRVELFARQSPAGWDVWGNEVECTAHLPMEETSCCG